MKGWAIDIEVLGKKEVVIELTASHNSILLYPYSCVLFLCADYKVFLLSFS